jgi:hypothetical protein
MFPPVLIINLKIIYVDIYIPHNMLKNQKKGEKSPGILIFT